MNFIAETTLAKWKLSFSTIKLFKLILAKSMKKVKPDFLLRNKLSICRLANYGVYFRRLSNGRQICFFLSAVVWPVLALTISPLLKKIITPEQVANLLPFYKQNYIYTCKVVAVSNDSHLRFCVEMRSEYTFGTQIPNLLML